MDRNDCPRCKGLPDYGIDYSKWTKDDTCHGCGSLWGDLFMERLEAGTVELEPTDKNYKVYVRNSGGVAFRMSHRIDSLDGRRLSAAANAKRLRCDHNFNGTLGGSCNKCGFRASDVLTDDDREDAERYEAGEPLDPMHNWVFVTKDQNHTKFYFQHLSAEQMKRFVELLNEKKLKIGLPGHFYSRPFFIV
jgi:hypothetical protein